MNAIKRSMAVIFLVMPLTAGSIASCEERAIGDNVYGPIDMAEYVNESIKLESSRRISQADDDSNIQSSTSGMLFNTMKKNRWTITQALLYGISNIDAGISRLTDYDALINLYHIDMDAVQATWEALHGKSSQKEVWKPEYIGDDGLIEFSDNTSAIIVTGVVSGIQRFVEEFGTIKNYPGFLAGTTGGSLFDVVRRIGLVILVLCFVFRLSWDMYDKNVLMQSREQASMLDPIYTSMKFMFLFLAIFYLRPLITKGMDISDTVNQLIQSTVSGMDSWDVMNDLLRAKALISQLRGNISIGEWLTEGAGTVIAKGLGYICYMLASAVVALLLILSDVIMGITAMIGPFVLALTMLPSLEGYVSSWMKGYITALVWGPLASLYVLLMIAILAVGIDTSAMTFIIISLGYLMGAMQIPNLAKSMSGAVMTGVALGLASAPMAGAKLAGRMGTRGIGGAAKGLKALGGKLGGGK